MNHCRIASNLDLVSFTHLHSPSSILSLPSYNAKTALAVITGLGARLTTHPIEKALNRSAAIFHVHPVFHGVPYLRPLIRHSQIRHQPLNLVLQLVSFRPPLVHLRVHPLQAQGLSTVHHQGLSRRRRQTSSLSASPHPVGTNARSTRKFLHKWRSGEEQGTSMAQRVPGRGPSDITKRALSAFDKLQAKHARSMHVTEIGSCGAHEGVAQWQQVPNFWLCFNFPMTDRTSRISSYPSLAAGGHFGTGRREGVAIPLFR